MIEIGNHIFDKNDNDVAETIAVTEEHCTLRFHKNGIEKVYMKSKIRRKIFEIPDFVLDDTFKLLNLGSHNYYYKNGEFYKIKKTKKLIK